MSAAPRVHLVLLARMGSRRLPGKMLLSLGEGTVFSTAVERFSAVRGVSRVVLATSDEPIDQALAEEGERLGLEVVRGSEDDVLGRMILATPDLAPDDVVIRACCDNPLVMPTVVEQAVSSCVRLGADVVTPFEFNGWPFGFGAVAMRGEALLRMAAEATDPAHREHVENFAFDHPERYRIAYCPAPAGGHRPGLSVSVDTVEDLYWARAHLDRLRDVPLERQPFHLVGAVASERDRFPRFWRPQADKLRSVERPGFRDEAATRFPPRVVLLDSAETRGGCLRAIQQEVAAHPGTELVEASGPDAVNWSATSRLEELIVGRDGRLWLGPDRSCELPDHDHALQHAWIGPAFHAERIDALHQLITRPVPTS